MFTTIAATGMYFVMSLCSQVNRNDCTEKVFEITQTESTPQQCMYAGMQQFAEWSDTNNQNYIMVKYQCTDKLTDKQKQNIIR